MKSKTLAQALLLVATTLLLAGCSNCEMKGSPFYTGEYSVNVPGAEKNRLNLWPLAYYREPALSVLWPVFEHTEEHVALRPVFSAYGDTKEYWEYNLLWPLCQADLRSHDYRIFPYFWGEDKREGNIDQDYHVLFPVLWHFEDESFALFPLWISDAGDWKDGRYTEHDYWAGWPLIHYHTGEKEEGWHVGTFGRYRYLDKDETYTGYPWPFFFSWRDKNEHGLFTPLYAYSASNTNDVRDGWAALPLALSWYRWHSDASDLNAVLGLYNQSWSRDNRSGYLLPLCAYDNKAGLFLTPVFGWDKPDPKDPDGYWYPLTPLAGVLTGAHRGGWLFPLFNHSENVSNGTFTTHALLLGYNERARYDWKEGSAQSENLGFFPLFSHSAYRSSTRNIKSGLTFNSTNRSDRQLLICYSEENRTTRQSPTNALDNYCQTSTSAGLFPLWDTGTSVRTRLDGTLINSRDESALLLALYDTKHTVESAHGKAAALDYERRRILWRVWHYEKRNGDVSVDIFPAITYDKYINGARSTGFLWRFFRYEKHADGKIDLDVLFLPLMRAGR